MLVRGAVAVVRQRRALARRAAAGGGTALEPLGDRIGREVLARERHVAIADLVDPQLRRHREVDPDVVEQRLGRLGEVVPVRCEPLDTRLAGAQDALVVRAPVVLLDDVWSKFSIDGTTEVVHRCLPRDAPYGGGPLRGPVWEVFATHAKTSTHSLLTSR